MASATCPYCGFKTDFPTGQEPEIGTRLTCEQCQHEFPARRVDETSTTSSQPGNSAPQGKNTAPATEPPPSTRPAGPVAGKVTISCPECGFSSAVPRAKIPPKPVSLSCRKCQHKFTFNILEADTGEAQEELHPVFAAKLAEPAAAVAENRPLRMSGLGELFNKSFQVFKQRLLVLIGINLLGTLLVVIASLLFQSGLGMLQSIFGQNLFTAILIGLLAGFFSLLAISWIAGATIYAVVEEDSGVREALNSGFGKIVPFLWVFSLLGFILGGGYMAFLLPGLLFTVWFIFAQYIIATEESRGMVALLKSREYVRGYGWEVCARIVLLGVLTAVVMIPLSFIPLVGPLLGLLIGPFTLIYYHEIYRDLRAIKGDIVVSCTTGEKAKWLVAGAAGYVIVPLLGLLLMGPSLQQSLLMALQGNQGQPAGLSAQRPDTGFSSQTTPATIAKTETMVYIFAYNYRGRITLNGEEIYIIEGEENMSYNHTSGITLAEGQNFFDIEYHTRFKSGQPEIRIKVYQFNWENGEETVLAEWTIDNDRGKKRFELNHSI